MSGQNRLCVDSSKVETTLNLRAQASIDADILASIPRFSCDLVGDGLGSYKNFYDVTYTTVDGAIDGWVSVDYISPDRSNRIETTALLLIDAWRAGYPADEYSYGLDEFPEPIQGGWPVPVQGPEGVGCVLVGDVTVECTMALVDRDGTEIARLSLTGTQRGIDGYDGLPYFPEDFPDGPRITSFSVVQE